MTILVSKVMGGDLKEITKQSIAWRKKDCRRCSGLVEMLQRW